MCSRRAFPGVTRSGPSQIYRTRILCGASIGDYISIFFATILGSSDGTHGNDRSGDDVFGERSVWTTAWNFAEVTASARRSTWLSDDHQHFGVRSRCARSPPHPSRPVVG